ncbi:MAG TPA: lipid II flippase MurJ, partial [Microthrixaceae bacterium]|nr:lipid II flippase MurJ [Microthrixaceae bacterium]
AGGGVEGGVVAYQVGWFFFLAPYGIIAQPIHTTILPELVADNLAGNTEAFKASIRWSLDSMCVLLLPLSALCAALSVPAMSVLAFGSADVSNGIAMLSVSLATLGLGLLPYGVFFLLARVFYVYDNSRTPAMAGAAVAAVGVTIMALAAVFADGTNLVMMLGLAHSAAFLVGSMVLTVALRLKVGAWVLPSLLGRSLGCSAIAGLISWFCYEQWDPQSKLGQTVALLILTALTLGIYVGLIRLVGVSVTKRIPRGGVPRQEIKN